MNRLPGTISQPASPAAPENEYCGLLDLCERAGWTPFPPSPPVLQVSPNRLMVRWLANSLPWGAAAIGALLLSVVAATWGGRGAAAFWMYVAAPACGSAAGAALLRGLKRARDDVRRQLLEQRLDMERRHKDHCERSHRRFDDVGFADVYRVVRRGVQVGRTSLPWYPEYPQRPSLTVGRRHSDYDLYLHAIAEKQWEVGRLIHLARLAAKGRESYSACETEMRVWLKQTDGLGPAFRRVVELVVQAAHDAQPELTAASEMEERKQEERERQHREWVAECARAEHANREARRKWEAEAPQRAAAAHAEWVRWCEEQAAREAAERECMAEQLRTEYERVCAAEREISGIGGLDQLAELKRRKEEILELLIEIERRNRYAKPK